MITFLDLQKNHSPKPLISLIKVRTSGTPNISHQDKQYQTTYGQHAQ